MRKVGGGKYGEYSIKIEGIWILCSVQWGATKGL